MVPLRSAFRCERGFPVCAVLPQGGPGELGGDDRGASQKHRAGWFIDGYLYSSWCTSTIVTLVVDIADGGRSIVPSKMKREEYKRSGMRFR